MSVSHKKLLNVTLHNKHLPICLVFFLWESFGEGRGVRLPGNMDTFNHFGDLNPTFLLWFEVGFLTW